jgi:hypothetical protein
MTPHDPSNYLPFRVRLIMEFTSSSGKQPRDGFQVDGRQDGQTRRRVQGPVHQVGSMIRGALDG